MSRAAGAVVVRFAPSPNGYLHLGHAYSALKNFELARRRGGTMLLRIEDIDRGRSRPVFEAAILEDLSWLGIAWARPVRRQSEHFDDYRAAIRRLDALGCLYPCFCSRGEIARAVAARGEWPRDPDGEPLYPGTCRRLAPAEAERRLQLGMPASRRLALDRALALCPLDLGWREFGETDAMRTVRAEPARWGDAVIARKDVPASYTLAVVVDDALQGVTDVVRGEDLYHATGLQRLVQELLALPAPCYHHHRLLRDAAGVKLSKSRPSTALRALREAGASPERVRSELGFG